MYIYAKTHTQLYTHATPYTLTHAHTYPTHTFMHLMSFDKFVDTVDQFILSISSQYKWNQINKSKQNTHTNTQTHVCGCVNGGELKDDQ